ncbi:MAG: MarR family transcriptional regulator [Dehalococcoidia bacterium]|nr:MarR family transcriptional regulator [Dehalococcoidia bacterium]
MTDSTVELFQAWSRVIRLQTRPGSGRRLRARAGAQHVPSPLYNVLSDLEERGATRISDLAALAGLDISTMSGTIKQLEERKYVTREPGADRRNILVSLTPAGAVAVRTSRQARFEALSELIVDFTDEERATLAHLFQRVAEAIVRVSAEEFCAGNEQPAET